MDKDPSWGGSGTDWARILEQEKEQGVENWTWLRTDGWDWGEEPECVARMRRRDEVEPCRVGWRARGEHGNVTVGQAVSGEGKGRQFCVHCSPSHTRQEHRLGFPAHVSLLSATCEDFQQNITSPVHADLYQR